MPAAELTLEAALRDAKSARAEARAKAIANLAPALLEDLGVPGPRWRAEDEHPRGPDVRRALGVALDDEDPALRGLAATGLATIGEPSVIERVQGWLEDEADDEAVAFLRQCATIAISLVGAAAPDDDDGRRTRRLALHHLRAALGSALPDVRFQAAIGLVEVGDASVESELIAALDRELSPEVRENLVAALSRIDPPGARTCARMRRLLDDGGDDAMSSIGLEAALLLAAARDPKARPRLVAALDHPAHRDRALEALAVLGAAPEADVERVRRMATSLRTPGVTRVRAAYAWSRMRAQGADSGDDPGRALLQKLRFHPRSAVREAVRDAMQLLTEP